MINTADLPSTHTKALLCANAGIRYSLKACLPYLKVQFEGMVNTAGLPSLSFQAVNTMQYVWEMVALI